MQQLLFILGRLRTAAIVLLILIACALLWKYNDDNRVLAAYSARYITPDDSPSEKTTKLIDAILHSTPPWGGSEAAKQHYLDDVANYGHLKGAWGPLSLSPREVLEGGGPCASKSRLLVSLLRLEGVPAHRVLLFDENQNVQHTLAEVQIEGGEWMFTDPLYGFYIPRPAGGYYSFDELQADEGIIARQIDLLMSENPEQLSPQLPRYLGNFTFQDPRVTFAWKPSTLVRRIPLEILELFLGEEGIWRTPRPYLLERPALMGMVLVGAVLVLLLATYLPGLLKPGRKNS